MREGANAEIYGGWPQILSGLKTLLETGEMLTTPGSLLCVDDPWDKRLHRVAYRDPLPPVHPTAKRKE